MKQAAYWALDTASKRGASYCDARIVSDRQRALATKNGKIGHAADSESLGIGIRVLVNKAWGFASTDNLSRESIEATAARAVEIGRASSRVQQHPIQLAAEKPIVAEWDAIVRSVEESASLGLIDRQPRDEFDYLSVNHFYNLFDLHLQRLLPPDEQERAGWR